MINFYDIYVSLLMMIDISYTDERKENSSFDFVYYIILSILANRTRDYSNHHNDLYRNSSIPSYTQREQFSSRPISQSRDYEIPSSRMNYSSSIDDLSRNSRDRNPSSYRDRPNLKRSGSRYNDNEPIPSKRPMRR